MRTGGVSMGRSGPTALRAFLALAAVLAVFALSACGNAASAPATSDPPDNLVSRAEIQKAPAGSLTYAFLEFWSSLQYQAWAEAASYYDPSFQSFVGTADIIGAKKLNASSYPELKPSIERITSRHRLVTVKYFVWLSEGKKELASITWRKVGGNWQIVYDSRLDAELDQLAQNRVEMATKGVLPTEASQVSPAAFRAGETAARAQARFVERKLDLSHP